MLFSAAAAAAAATAAEEESLDSKELAVEDVSGGKTGEGRMEGDEEEEGMEAWRGL